MHQRKRPSLRSSVALRGLCALALLCGAGASTESSRAESPLASSARIDDEILQEFRKYFKKYKDSATRVEAVLSLEGVESTGVVDELVRILGDEDQEVVRACVRVLAGFETNAPVAHLWETLDSKKDEAIRAGLLRAIADGGYSPDAHEDGREILAGLLEDKSWAVRRRVVGAIAALGEEGAAEAIAPLCEDKEVAVRCAAFDGLASLRSELVLEPALASLEHASWQIRASAIGALSVVRDKRSIPPLIARLAAEEGRLRADVAHALEAITGRGYGMRVEGWQGFWDTFGDRYEIPTDQELARLREAQRERAESYGAVEGAVTYHGVETPSRSMLFIIDVSGSMENQVVERDRFEDGEYPSLQRIDIVKTELRRTIENLESYVEFNILSFATEVDAWKRDLVKANVVNKSSADDYCRKLEALGGNSRNDLAEAGLTASANLAAGKTNTYGVLMEALDAAGRGAADEHYEVAVDTIFFLSDGRPSTGQFIDTNDILREVRNANELRKVVIHTIAIGEFQKDFMRSLAEQNGGVFVDLGR